MTPHDELMALAGRWDRWALDAAAHSDEDGAELLKTCAADLRALLDSDAFRAMVRDAERYRWLRRPDAFAEDYLKVKGGISAIFVSDGRVGVATDTEALDAAIDAAASGAGEE